MAFLAGLATFVSALNDPKVGLVLAIAIAIHNIPEGMDSCLEIRESSHGSSQKSSFVLALHLPVTGICVAMPVYYATGSRWRAFGWALLSGISEPIAAVFGWLLLANSFSENLYAVLFGMVSGAEGCRRIVVLSIRWLMYASLLPTAPLPAGVGYDGDHFDP